MLPLSAESTWRLTRLLKACTEVFYLTALEIESVYTLKVQAIYVCERPTYAKKNTQKRL